MHARFLRARPSHHLHYKIAILSANAEAEALSEAYIQYELIPKKYMMDAIHIAIATIHSVDYIISLNFSHINKVKTKIGADFINRIYGYTSPFICTPLEV
jgi:hypothetical protein